MLFGCLGHDSFLFSPIIFVQGVFWARSSGKRVLLSPLLATITRIEVLTAPPTSFKVYICTKYWIVWFIFVEVWIWLDLHVILVMFSHILSILAKRNRDFRNFAWRSFSHHFLIWFYWHVLMFIYNEVALFFQRFKNLSPLTIALGFSWKLFRTRFW